MQWHSVGLLQCFSRLICLRTPLRVALSFSDFRRLYFSFTDFVSQSCVLTHSICPCVYVKVQYSMRALASLSSVDIVLFILLCKLEMLAPSSQLLRVWTCCTKSIADQCRMLHSRDCARSSSSFYFNSRCLEHFFFGDRNCKLFFLLMPFLIDHNRMLY